tara:strand:+ start:1328 stop:2512 length:1185 start_codon:yes stop_codon:yes gene_type:complete
MSLTIDAFCDFCKNKLEKKYNPVNTKRGMQVCVCTNCGLVQSVQSQEKPDKRIQTLSCNADWGNVRHGKGLRLNHFKNAVKNCVNWKNVNHVLDVGSNRGSFVNWLLEENNRLNVTAVEPDSEIIKDNYKHKNVNLIVDRFENISLEKDFYEFVYCSHTLEHSASALGMLKQIRSYMKYGAYLFLEVPNLKNIEDSNIVEEFFMDKHTFHFDRETLYSFLKRMGFTLVYENEKSDMYNIAFVLQKSDSKTTLPHENTQSNVKNNAKSIERYNQLLSDNRKLLQTLVEKKLKPLAKRQKVAYWGAGRIFDALLKYGGLTVNNVYALVDKHLWDKVDNSQGTNIQRPEILRILEPNVVVALARSSEETIAKTAKRMGVRHVLRFNELMEQTRILIN